MLAPESMNRFQSASLLREAIRGILKERNQSKNWWQRQHWMSLKSTPLSIPADSLFESQAQVREALLALLGWRVSEALRNQFANTKPGLVNVQLLGIQPSAITAEVRQRPLPILPLNDTVQFGRLGRRKRNLHPLAPSADQVMGLKLYGYPGINMNEICHGFCPLHLAR